MDAYEILKLEMKGIGAVIKEYSSNGNIKNFLEGLEEGINSNSTESVKYYLNEICLWYKENIDKIHSNELVFNNEEHDRNKKLLEDINGELRIDRADDVIKDEKTADDRGDAWVFISHCSSNKKYGDALEKLLTGLGVKDNQIIYTSHPLHKIPLNENIYDYLRNSINKNVFVIILWSNEYLKSPACLNEMGAAWVTQTDYVNMYTPNFSFDNPKYNECAVDIKKMGVVLNGNINCKASMIEFRDKILEIFGNTLDDSKWTYLLDQFIEDIQ